MRRFFEDIWNIPSLIFFIVNISHNMTPREGFTLLSPFLNFLCPFQLLSKTVGMKILGLGPSLAKLAWRFWEGVDFFVLHVQRSYGGGTQRSQPPQMPRELLPLRNLALSSAQMPIDVPIIWEAMIRHLRSRPPQMTNQCLLILDHVHM